MRLQRNLKQYTNYGTASRKVEINVAVLEKHCVAICAFDDPWLNRDAEAWLFQETFSSYEKNRRQLNTETRTRLGRRSHGGENSFRRN